MSVALVTSGSHVTSVAGEVLEPVLLTFLCPVGCGDKRNPNFPLAANTLPVSWFALSHKEISITGRGGKGVGGGNKGEVEVGIDLLDITLGTGLGPNL